MRYGKLEKGLYFEWEIEVNAPLSEVWDFASNTDRLNAAIGSGTNEYTEIPNPKGGSFLYGKTVNGGIVSEFREFPYEWLENKYVGVYREYSRGPVKKMLFDNIFTETENGFKIKFIMQFETSSFIFNPIIKFEVYKNSIPNFRETFKHLEKFAKRIESKPLPVFGFVPSSGDNQRRSELINKFNIIKTEDSIREKIAIYILDTPDNDLLKIKPYAVAHQIGENKRRVLEFFLRATKEGFFDLNWDILCPSCRGPKSSSRHLNELEDSVHCPTCNIDYSGEFDKSVELTFVPTEKLRKVEGGIYCFGGPGRTPHIRVQWRVKGKGNEKVKYFVQKGTYRIFSLQKKEIINIECDPNFPEVKEINYPNTEDLIRCATGEIEFNFENSDEEECLIRIERTTWMDDIVTAYEVTAMQEFRDLFSSEVLKPGQEIGVKNIAILFTDLKGSTRLYNEKGDAFSYKVVSDHFDILIENAYKHEGAIVKTIGDAVMAIFLNPLNAIEYAINIQSSIDDLNEKLEEKFVSLKVGIHYGPALAVTMNEKLDYFGTTVNLAARTEGQCKGDDIVITKTLYNYPGVVEMLMEKKVKLEEFQTEIKGFDRSYSMVRILP